jgi:Flp pilus assembly protein TadG
MDNTVNRRLATDAGNATIEFIAIVVAIIMPMVYIVVAASQVHAASMASEHAVREAARAFTMAQTPGGAQFAARAAAKLAMSDYGIDLPDHALTVRCSGACLQPETNVNVQVRWLMPLPWLPSMFDAQPAISIRAEQTLPIDTYRGEP